MPVENSKPEAEKLSTGGGDMCSPASGKKRKKKKKDRCGEPATRGATFVKGGEIVAEPLPKGTKTGK